MSIGGSVASRDRGWLGCHGGTGCWSGRHRAGSGRSVPPAPSAGWPARRSAVTGAPSRDDRRGGWCGRPWRVGGGGSGASAPGRDPGVVATDRDDLGVDGPAGVGGRPIHRSRTGRRGDVGGGGGRRFGLRPQKVALGPLVGAAVGLRSAAGVDRCRPQRWPARRCWRTGCCRRRCSATPR